MDRTHELVPAAHRALRRVDAQDSAFAGELITDGDRVRVRIDVDAVPETLWVFADAEHVAGVRDVLRRSDGHDALLPWCTERVEAFLGRRAGAEQPLTAGEMVTLVGSLLRGLGEVGDTAAQGRWWLTDDLRPLFVPGDGTSCVAASISIIERLRAVCADRAMERMLADLAQMPDDARAVARNLERWEQELTELAAPRPLEREELVPTRVDAIPAHRALLPEVARQVTAQRGTRRNRADADRQRRPASRAAGERPEWRRMLPAVTTGVHAAVARLRDRFDERRREGTRQTARNEGRGSTAGRGRMLLAGAAVAAVVLVGGLLWPGEEDDTSSALESPASPANAGGEATQSPTPSPAGSQNEPADDETTDEAASAPRPATAEEAAAALLTMIGACARNHDDVCAAAIVGGAGATVMQRIGDDVEDRAPVLIEDYGDIAVVRLAAGHVNGEQMLVLVGQNDGWLVRDVYDVADQPSGEG